MLTEEWKEKFKTYKEPYNPYKGKKLSVIGDSSTAYSRFLAPDNSGIRYDQIYFPDGSKAKAIEEARCGTTGYDGYDISRSYAFQHSGKYYEFNTNGTVKFSTYSDTEGNTTLKMPRIEGPGHHGYFCIPYEEMLINLKLILGSDYDQFKDFFEDVFDTYHTRLEIIRAILGNKEIQDNESIFNRVKRALQGHDPMRDDTDPYYDSLNLNDTNRKVTRNGVEKMYWYKVCEELEMEPLRIYGWSGRSVTGIAQYRNSKSIYRRRLKGWAYWDSDPSGANVVEIPARDQKGGVRQIYLPTPSNIESHFHKTQSGYKAPFKKPLYDIRELIKLGNWEIQNGESVCTEAPDVVIIRCLSNDLNNIIKAKYTGNYYGFDLLGDYDGSEPLNLALQKFFGTDDCIIDDICHIYIKDKTNGGANAGQNDTLGKLDYYFDQISPKQVSENTENGVKYVGGKRYITLERAIDEGAPTYYDCRNDKDDSNFGLTQDEKNNLPINNSNNYFADLSTQFTKNDKWIYEDKRRRYLCDFSLAAALTIARLKALYPGVEIYWYGIGPSDSLKSTKDKVATRYFGESIYYTDGNAPQMPRRYITEYTDRLKQICEAMGATMVDGSNSNRYLVEETGNHVKYNYNRQNMTDKSNYSNYKKPIVASHYNEEGNEEAANNIIKAMLCDRTLDRRDDRPELKILTIGGSENKMGTRWLWSVLDKAGYKATVGNIIYENASIEDICNICIENSTVKENVKFSDIKAYYREYKHREPIIKYNFTLGEIFSKTWDICIFYPTKAEYGRWVDKYYSDSKTISASASTKSPKTFSGNGSTYEFTLDGLIGKEVKMVENVTVSQNNEILSGYSYDFDLKNNKIQFSENNPPPSGTTITVNFYPCLPDSSVVANNVNKYYRIVHNDGFVFYKVIKDANNNIKQYFYGVQDNTSYWLTLLNYVKGKSIKAAIFIPNFFDYHYMDNPTGTQYSKLARSFSWKEKLEEFLTVPSIEDSDAPRETSDYKNNWDKQWRYRIKNYLPIDSTSANIISRYRGRRLTVEQRRKFFYEIYYKTLANYKLLDFDFIINGAYLTSIIINNDLLINDSSSSEQRSFLNKIKNNADIIKNNVGGNLLAAYKKHIEQGKVVQVEPTVDEYMKKTIDGVTIGKDIGAFATPDRDYMITEKENSILLSELDKFFNDTYYGIDEESESDNNNIDYDNNDLDDSDMDIEDEDNKDSSIQNISSEAPQIIMPLVYDYNSRPSFYFGQFLFSYYMAALAIGYNNLFKHTKPAASASAANKRNFYDYYFKELINKNIKWYPTAYDAWYISEKYQMYAVQAKKETAEAINALIGYLVEQDMEEKMAADYS